MLNTIQTATGSSNTHWSGSVATGGLGNTCSNWISAASTGTGGSRGSTSSTWLNSAGLSCGFSLNQICVYYVPPLTASPTYSPTTEPTHEPTQPPTQVIKGRVMYKISQGSSLGVVRNTKDVNFTLAIPPPQIQLSETTSGAAATLLPIQWSGLYLRLYNTTSSATETYYQEGPCNPAVESVPPGTDGQALPDGTDACMSVYTCASLGLGDDCTATLNPVGVTPRVCLCNVTTESLHPFYPTKTLGATPEEFSLWKGVWTVDNPLPNPFDVFGSIDCRNPIDREVNCQLFCLSTDL